MNSDVLIIGGGPAGSTAAIELGRAGISVTLLEKTSLPRHTLCGEFVSGDGVNLLANLGLATKLRAAGAVDIRNVQVTCSAGDAYSASLPGGPVSISRYRLDCLLLREASASGAVVLEKTAAAAVTGSLADGFTVTSDAGSHSARVVLGAFGRSSRLPAALGRKALPPLNNPFVAFKTHCSGPFPDGTVELHAFAGGYCGLQRVEDELVNACWITRSSRLKSAGGKPERMIRATFIDNARLADRFDTLVPVFDRFLAASQLEFRPRSAVQGDVLMIGDSAGMIAPMCGDGISMAIAGGMSAARLVEAYIDGRVSRDSLLTDYIKGWRRSFSRRMTVGRVMHHGFVVPSAGRAGIVLCNQIPAVGRWLTRATRG